MKRLLTILILLTVCFFAKAQNPIPADSAFPIKQSIANAPNTIGVSNVLQGKGGFVNGKFLDTTAANRTRIKFYPGAQIFTTVDSSLWLRNAAANAWIKSSSTSGNGDIYNINDSTIVICPVAGACDTIHLNNSNTYYFFFSGDTTYLVTCDTVQTICVGDSCYQQQVCDTIALNAPPAITVYQNGLWKSGDIVEFGDLGGGQASLIHNTVLNAYAYNLLIKGQSVGLEPLSIQLNQIPDLNTSLQSWLHSDGYQNTVRIRMNYTNPFYADTIGYMYNRTAYLLMTNSTGSNYHYNIDDVTAKQVGIGLHTTDITNTDAVTIFGNQVPATYCLTCNPQTDTTLYDSRIAIFKTDKNIQFPGYDSSRNEAVTNKAIYGADADGNLKQGTVVAGSAITIINDTTITICSFGTNLCDTFVVNNIGVLQTVTIINDSTLLVCDSVGVCDTLFINHTSFVEAPLIIQNSLWVTKNGNDAQGIRNRVDKPYLTIRAAINAAQTGDVVIVWPGTYEEQVPISLSKSINFQFMGKGELRLLASLTTGNMITDSNTTSVSVIDAPGWVFNGRGGQKVIELTAPSSVTVYANQMVSSTGKVLNILDSASINVKANYLYSNSFSGVVWVDSALSVTATIDLIEAGSFGSALWTRNTNDIQIYAKRIIAAPDNDDNLIYFNDTNAGDSIYVEADEIRAGTEWAVWGRGASPAMFVRAKSISANSDCVVVSSADAAGQMLTVNADVIENFTTGTIDAIGHAEGGNLTLINARIKRNALATGPDIRTIDFGGLQGTLKLSNVSYDKTKVSENVVGTIKRIDSLYYGSNFQFTEGRLETDTAIIVAANNSTLGRGNVQIMSGNTTVNAITTAGWQAGSASVFIIFSGTPTVKNNTAGGAGTARILLAGLTDFVAAAGDVLELLYDGTYWREASRTLAASAGGLLFARTDALNASGSMYFDNAAESMLWDNINGMQFNVMAGFGVNDYSSGLQRLSITPVNSQLYSADNDAIITLDANEIDILNTAGRVELTAVVSGTSSVITLNTGGIGEIGLSANGYISLSTDDSLYLEGLGFSANTRRKVLTIDTITHTVAWGNSVTADNGLTANTATNVQLFGPVGTPATLLNSRYLDASTFNLNITGSFNVGGTALLDIYSTGGDAISGESVGGVGVTAQSSATYAFYGVGANGIYAFGEGLAGKLETTGDASTVQTLLELSKGPNSSVSAGVGIGIDFKIKTTTGFEVLHTSNYISSYWTDVAAATRTSTLNISGLFGGSSVDLLTLAGNGSVKLRPITATEASAITPAEGMLVMVSNTNGTFVSIGIWAYQNGAWKAL